MFAKYFEFILTKYSNEMKDNLGLDVKDIRVHLLRKGVAGDQYVGGIFSGVHICSPQFAELLLQFDCCVKDSEYIAKIVFPNLLLDLMSAGKLLFACLMFHLGFLQNILTLYHPLLLTSFCYFKKVSRYEEECYC